MENPDLDNALLTIIAEVRTGVIKPSQALTEIKQAVAYYTPKPALSDQADAAERKEAERFQRGVPGHSDNSMGM